MNMSGGTATKKTKYVALLGVLFALSLVLSFFESTLAAVMALPPGVKLGLSNIVVMFSVLVLGGRSAFSLALLKSMFAFLTRGAVSGLLSLAGGLLSVIIMELIIKNKNIKVSARLLSVIGAISHNAGQVVVSFFILGTGAVLYYTPILLISAIAAGVVTGSIYIALSPYLNRLF